jgi:uncharacterized membrane protein
VVPTTPLPVTTRVLCLAFGLSGVVHLVRPQVFDPLIPPVLPARRALVYLSGVAEIACGIGLQRRSRWAPSASALLLLAVWPGNAQHALNVQRSPRASTLQKAVMWGRLPLQLPMIRAALGPRRARSSLG